MTQSLSSCIAKAGALLSNQDKAALLSLARDYRSQGLSALEAAQAAVDEHLAVVGAQVDDAAAVEDVAREQAEVKQSAPRDPQTETAEFKKWFRDSKVVDAEGNPRMVFHGTKNAPAAFAKSRVGSASTMFGDYEVERHGIFVAEDVALAEEYANQGEHPTGQTVMPLYVRIEDPLDTYEGQYTDAIWNKIEDAATKLGADNSYRVARMLGDAWGRGEMWKLLDKDSEHDDPAWWVKLFKAAGYDGLRIAERSELDTQNTAAWVAFDPEQIKSATGNSGSFDNNKADITQSTPRTPWYSGLQQAIAGVPDRLASMGAAQWKLWLDANAAKLGVKKDEIEWSGVKEFLDTKGKAKVTREEIVSYLDANGVKVEEAVLGAKDNSKALNDWLDTTAMAVFDKPFAKLKRDDQVYLRGRAEREFISASADTKYHSYTLPGGENYRELLLTLPVAEANPAWEIEQKAKRAEAMRELQKEFAGIGNEGVAASFGKKADALDDQLAELKKRPKPKLTDNYKSSHWDAPNVVAHIRVDDRVDADGKRVLFVNEIQSDWGQDGKKKGFQKPDMPEAQVLDLLSAEGFDAKNNGTNWVITAKDGGEVPNKLAGGSAKNQFANNLAQVAQMVLGRSDLRAGVHATPAAPFVTKTDAWVALALKRAIKLAVDEGYDRVAMVTGQQAADFFDLSKQVDQIAYDRVNRSSPVAYRIKMNRVGAHAFEDAGVHSAADLADVVGKEIAQKIIDDESGSGNLRGLDLKVGGEGMKGFYDTLVPNVTRDILKKMGGGKLEMVNLGTGSPGGYSVTTSDDQTIIFNSEADAQEWLDENNEDSAIDSVGDGAGQQPGFTITPAMREKAAGGMVMFSKAREAGYQGQDAGESAEWLSAKANGLDMSHAARMARAKAMGFDVKEQWYHGTNKALTALKTNKKEEPGVWFVSDPTVASDYAESHRKPGTSLARGGNVMPVLLRSRTFDEVAKNGEAWSAEDHDAAYTAKEDEFSSPGTGGVIFRDTRDYLTSTSNASSARGSHDTAVVFQSAIDRGAVRSIYAAFDPAQSSSKDISASAARDPQTETPAFKAWFGESKVVDADGKPLVVYHGTTSDENFNTFKPDSHFGTRLSAHQRIEQLSIRGRYGDGSLMPVYLSMQNPKRTADAITTAKWNLAVDAAKLEGHDGIVYRNEAEDKGSHSYIAFKPEQIKSATGNNGNFDQASADITQSTIRDKLDQAINQPKISIVGETSRTHTPEQLAAMRRVGFQVETPSLKDRAKALTQGLGKRLAQGIFDQFAPIKDLDQHAYLLTRLSKGASGAFESFLHGGKLKLSDGVYDFDETQKGGVLDKLLMPLQGEHHDLFRWIAANRAERLTAEGKENLFTAEDIAALKTLAQGQTAFDYTLQHGPQAGQVTRDRNSIYNDSLKTFNDFSDNIMDMAEQSGLIDGEARKMWSNEFYVPFYRVADDVEGGVRGMGSKGSMVRQEAFKKLKGGKNALNADLLDNTLMNWAHLLDASAKNRAAKATLEAAVNLGVAVEANETTVKQMGKSAKTAPVWFQDSGKQRFFIVEDPMLLTAISSLEYAGMRNPVMNAMSTLKHALTVGVTASPFFKLKNLVRDTVQVIGTSPIGVNPAANLAQGWKLTDPKSDAYFRLLAGGGTIHFGTMLEGSEAKRIQALVESGVARSTILNDEHAVKAFYRKVIEPTITAYNELGNRGEAINRAALYDQLVKGGMGHGEASLLARDLMDFSLSGSFTSIRFLTQVLPFFNARLQGIYKLGRYAKEDPKRMALVTGAIAMASVALLAAYGDDDDWKKREDWDRNGMWWFKIGGVAYRIPKPFELGAIATLAERGFEFMFDKEMTGQRLRSQVLALLSDNLAMNPVPQAFKPIMEMYANKDSFSGRPIETPSMEKLKSEYRFNDRTSMVARGASTGLNAVTGLIGQSAPSPVMIDQMLKGYFGWLGSFVVGSADVILRPASSQPAQARPDLWKLATGSLISDLRDAPSRYVSQMYDQAKELEMAHGTWQMLVKSGKTGEAAEFKAEHQTDLQRFRQVESVKQSTSHINTRTREIERDTVMTPDEKREALRRLQEQRDKAARRVAP